MSKLTVTFLGTGTSQGVPVIACGCATCTSKDTKDNRLRSSVMLSFKEKNYVIDSGPDFRQQMLANNVKSLEALIFTHAHKDHMAGMDDVRAFNFKQKRDMPVYCDTIVEQALRREFYYVFQKNSYPGIPRVLICNFDKNPFQAGDLTFVPIEVVHYKLPVKAFRIGDFTYITDAKTISDQEIGKIMGTKILVVNALKREEHPSHFNLEEALAFIERVQPEKAYLTHISHLFGRHAEISKELPGNVAIAYDKLKLEIDYNG